MTPVGWLTAAGLGGGAAILRFLIDGAVSSRMGRDFPFGTLLVNASGALALGLVIGLALHGDEAVLVGSATIGSYTTFSTWVFETQRLSEEGERANAFANVAISLALGLAAVALGRLLGGQL